MSGNVKYSIRDFGMTQDVNYPARTKSYRHSTPKKTNMNVDFDSTQYIPLNINSHICHKEKVCSKCLLFKAMPFRYRNVDDVIRRLEEIKYRLDQNDDYLNKTRLTMFELRKNNCNLRKGLDDHLESIKGVLVSLSDVSSHLTSLMAKEDLFLSYLTSNTS